MPQNFQILVKKKECVYIVLLSGNGIMWAEKICVRQTRDRDEDFLQFVIEIFDRIFFFPFLIVEAL